MAEGCSFWLLALPLAHREQADGGASAADDDRSALHTLLRDRLAVAADAAHVSRLALPALKVGTLDSLVAVGEEAARLDPLFASCLSRAAGALRALLPDGDESVASALTVGDGASPARYVRAFRWDALKYRADCPIAEVLSALSAELSHIDGLLRAKLAAHAAVRAQLAERDRRASGPLLSRDLSGVVRGVAPASEYLAALLVAVPTSDESAFLGAYERLADMVVPRSATRLLAEGDTALYAVTLMARAADAFARAAAERKWSTRACPSYSEEGERAAAESADAIAADEAAQRASLLRLLRTNFGELFAAWTHLKVLRVFVEAVLRYGLPPHYAVFALRLPHSADASRAAADERRVRRVLLALLDQLRLPGVSAIDVAAALHAAGGRTDDARAPAAHESSDEAELWAALNMGGLESEDPFVVVPLRWSP